jgi:hypothetical protein
MSLINDALKRASEAQQREQAPRPELKFREAEPRGAGPKRFGWVWAAVITACVVTGVFVFWGQRRASNSKIQTSNVAEGEDANQAGKHSFGSSSDLKVHAREEQVLPGAALASAKTVEPAQTEKVAVVAVGGTTIQETTKREVTNAPASSEAVVVKAGPKLQGIVFNPASPSATISGKTVFVGEKVGEWRVIAIGRESATLVGNGETNVLRMGE